MRPILLFTNQIHIIAERQIVQTRWSQLRTAAILRAAASDRLGELPLAQRAPQKGPDGTLYFLDKQERTRDAIEVAQCVNRCGETERPARAPDEHGVVCVESRKDLDDLCF